MRKASAPRRRRQRRVGRRGQEQRHRRHTEHREGHQEDRCDGPPGDLSRRQYRPRDAHHRLREWRVPEQEVPHDEPDHRHAHHPDEDEHDDGHELGHEEPGPADRADQEVPQGAGLRLTGDRVARHDGDSDRQEQRQHDGQRRNGEQRPVGDDRRQERRPLSRARGDPGPRQQHADQGRQQVEQADRHPGAAPSEQLGQLDPDHRATSPGRRAEVRSSMTCSSVRRSGPSSRTATPAATSRAFTPRRVGRPDDESLARRTASTAGPRTCLRRGRRPTCRRRSARWAPAAWTGTPG